jgi:exopolysaccharide production protein ExoQ
MPPVVALLVFVVFILWLFALERKRRTGVSSALWIPTLWVLIIASRPVSQWLHPGAPDVTVGMELEGSPIDRAFYFAIIIAGFLVLNRRRLDWGRVFSQNPWVFLFYGYFAVSVIWSAHPDVSLKRLFKDFGNVIMILVVLTEVNPIAAVKSLLARCTYVLLPLSVLFIQYFPELGRGYVPFTWEPYFSGVTTGKNTLGAVLIIFGLFLVWEGSERWTRNRQGTKRQETIAWVLVVFMEFWLLWKAHSSTSLGCFIFGSVILLAMRMPYFQRKARHLGIYGAVIIGIVFVLNSVFNLGQFFAESLGRDATLTGRTEIWDRVLHSGHTNPIFGEGFWIFWDSDKSANLFPEFFFRLLQSHNGYIEMYVDGGFVGLLILAGLAGSFLGKAKQDILRGSSFGVLYLLFALVALVYNYTEAAFARLSLVWFAQLLAGIQIPREPTRKRIPREETRNSSSVAAAA